MSLEFAPLFVAGRDWRPQEPPPLIIRTSQAHGQDQRTQTPSTKKETMMRKVLIGALIIGLNLASISHGEAPDSSAGDKLDGKLSAVNVTYAKRNWGDGLFCSCSYTISTNAKRIKKPIVFSVILWESKDTSWILARGAVGDPRPSSTESGETLSRRQDEVDTSTIRSGSMRNEHCASADWHDKKFGKILLWRVELWCDGKLLAVQTNATEAKLKQLTIDEDWYSRPEGPFPGK